MFSKRREKRELFNCNIFKHYRRVIRIYVNTALDFFLTSCLAHVLVEISVGSKALNSNEPQQKA